MAEEKTVDDARKFAERVAEHNGWEVVEDSQFLNDLLVGLKDHYNQYGYYLCPCRDGAGERLKDKDVICPCVYLFPDQEEYGHCYCGLFLTPEFAKSGKTPRQIPERRPESLWMQ